MSHEKDFINKVRAGFPLIVVKSSETFRVLEQYVSELSQVPIKDETGKVIGNYKTFQWDVIDGCRVLQMDASGNFQIGDATLTVPGTDNDGNKVEVSSANNPMAPLTYIDQIAKNGSVIFIKDFHDFIKDDAEYATVLKAMLRKLATEFRSKRKCIVLLSPTFKIPVELAKDIAVIDFALPDRDTLKKILELVVGTNASKLMPKGDALEAVLDAAAGMTAIEAENAFCVSLTIAKRIDASIIRQEKAQVVKKDGLLEIIEATETMADIGGLENLKAWISLRAKCFTPEAKAYGVKTPKGILLIGVPGCGKSLTAKASASGLQRPLVRLDMGKIFGSYVGESEENMSRCLTVLESIAPCVLWIDEIEKGLSGNKAGSEGHETTRRVFQMLLTWLQDKKKDVLLVATANSIESLPPELLRAGRIDATFYVDLPGTKQREEILRIHLKKAGRKPTLMDAHMPELMVLCKNWTGAEIECWLNETVTRAFSLGHSEIQIEDFRAAQGEITPVFKLSGAAIEKDRHNMKQRGTKWASIEDPADASVTTAQSPGTRVVDMDSTSSTPTEA